MIFPNNLELSNLNREEVINLLLASIGFEELALAYLIKSEADLLQRALGNLTDDEECCMVNFLEASITGEFIEGSLSTICNGNSATIQGSVTLGGPFYHVIIQANQDGTATATFEGASTFTITLTGANVAIGQCAV